MLRLDPVADRMCDMRQTAEPPTHEYLETGLSGLVQMHTQTDVMDGDRGTVFRRTGDQTLAEDLTGQVFLKMLEAIRNRKAWHSSFSGWIYRIAHNIVIDFYRQRGTQQQVSLDDEPMLTSLDDNPVSATELKLDVERLRAAIDRLTDEQAEVISLRFLEGYSINEVAEMMNKSEGSIKALQYRAVANLRQLLQVEV